MCAIGEAKGEKRCISIKHKKNMLKYLENASDYLSQFNAAFTRYNAQAAELVKKRYTPTQVNDFLQTLIPKTKDMTERQLKNVEADKNAILSCLGKENMLRSVEGTVWALYNSVTRWVDHEQNYKGTTVERNDNRWKTITEGTGAALKAQALELALSL